MLTTAIAHLATRSLLAGAVIASGSLGAGAIAAHAIASQGAGAHPTVSSPAPRVVAVMAHHALASATHQAVTTTHRAGAMPASRLTSTPCADGADRGAAHDLGHHGMGHD